MGKTKTQTDAADKATPPPAVDVETETPEKEAEPSRATPVQRAPAAALPPPGREPPAARAADMLASSEPGPGAAGRARMMTGMQQSVGNTRVSRMLGAGATSAAPA